MVLPVPFASRTSSLTHKADHMVGTFFAMGCPCEVLMETQAAALAEQILKRVRNEVWRIEAQWSRYLEHSIVERINRDPQKTHQLDEETSALIEYGQQLWHLSDGKFDITSGVYRKIWTFDGGSGVPSRAQIERVKACVGWDRVCWSDGKISMQAGMEIDLGGIGKEYAVDACCNQLRKMTDVSCLVNFGGDCGVTVAPKNRPGWTLGIESASHPGVSFQTILLTAGGVATSGNVHRYIMHDGKRLSHVIDATSGWPICNAPKTVTVRADTCLEAGSMATLACLQGAGAREFLNEDAEFWIQES